MRTLPKRLSILLALLASLAALPAAADPFSGPTFMGGGSSYAPSVPVSAFARPASWFDPSRLQFSTTVTVGSGWGGQGTDALQVTRMSYQFGAPLALRVGIGNAFGASRPGMGNGMFLEGFELAYRPHRSFQINVQYQDVRSPLQVSPYYGYGLPGR